MVEPLLHPPVAFAHRGGRAHAPDNTMEAFTTGLRLGATGLETDAWASADGVAMLDHGGRVRMGLRPKRISSLSSAELAGHVPSLADLYAGCGSDFELSVDVGDEESARAVVGAARARGPEATGRLWLCHHEWSRLAEWRADPAFDGIRLVDSTRLATMREGPERRAARLAEVGIEALNMHWTDWTAGLVTLFHRFGRLTLGWDAQHERMISALVKMGIDGVYSDHVDRMTAVMGKG